MKLFKKLKDRLKHKLTKRNNTKIQHKVLKKPKFI